VREAVAKVLIPSGYCVRVAADGEAALVELDSFEADLVLAALHMPRMDGLELLRELNRRPAPPAVVIMTTFDGIESAVAALREGAVQYLTKPLNLDELLLVVERCLERVRLTSEVHALKDQVEGLSRFNSAFGSAPTVPSATMLDFERYIILKTLAATGGSVAKAAAALGISMRKIHYRLREYREVSEAGRSETAPDLEPSGCVPGTRARG